MSFYLISEMKFKCRESGFAAAESRRGHMMVYNPICCGL